MSIAPDGTAPDGTASTDEVVRWLLGPGHLSCLDEDGHPLGEQASPRYTRAHEEAHRRFGDARDATHLPCNVGALRAIRAAWPFMLAAVRGFDPASPPTMRRTLRRAEAGRNLALLMGLRAPDRAVPRHIAALYKATLGFGGVLTSALLEGRVDADDPPPSDAQLGAWLDEHPWLIGERQVCAGTRAQIRTLYRALSIEDGPAHETWSAPWIAPALDALEELHALAAAATGAARPHVLSGRSEPGSTCEHLFVARDVPRVAEALRQVLDAGALHPTLLFASDAVPSSLCAFLEALPATATSDRPLTAIDALLERCARPVAERLLLALDRSPTALTLAAFAT